MRSKINAVVGNFLAQKGYFIDRLYRKPESTLSTLSLGASILDKSGRGLNILQIGAFDGKFDDPLQWIIRKGRHSVLFVEPQVEPMKKLKEVYSEQDGFLFEQSAIFDYDGQAELYFHGRDMFAPTASLLKKHVSNFGIDVSKAKSQIVNCLTVESLLKKHDFFKIDLLQIDAEGLDLLILKQFFFIDIEPNIINLETFHLSESDRNWLKSELDSRGYARQDAGLDTVAIKKNVLI